MLLSQQLQVTTPSDHTTAKHQWHSHITFTRIAHVVKACLNFVTDLACAAWQVSLDAEDIRNEKVKVLRNMSPISMEDVVIGQYRGRGNKQGYLDDSTVPEGRYSSGLAPCMHASQAGTSFSMPEFVLAPLIGAAHNKIRLKDKPRWMAVTSI